VIAALIERAAIYPLLLVANGAAWYMLETSQEVASFWTERQALKRRWGIAAQDRRILAGYMFVPASRAQSAPN
jgi:hypothetical protein